MSDLKTTEEISRTPDGSEYIRLATTGANWKTTLSNVFSALGPPGSPGNSLQFNLAGAFTGDADLTWEVGKGSLNKVNTAIGNYADADFIGTLFAPGDPLFGTNYEIPTNLVINHLWSGDLRGYPTGAGSPANVLAMCTFDHTGAGTTNILYGLDVEPAISSNNVGHIGGFEAGYFSANNFGTGTVDELIALELKTNQYRSSGVPVAADAYCLKAGSWIRTGTLINNYVVHIAGNQTFGGTPTITNNYGLYIADQANIGGTQSLNINSVGSGGHRFEGSSAFGSYGAVTPAGMNTVVKAPGDPTLSTSSTQRITVNVNERYSADLSFITAKGLTVYPGFKHTGANVGFLFCTEYIPTVNSDSTGPLGVFTGLTFAPYNYGSGTISSNYGIFGGIHHEGSGDITFLASGFVVQNNVAGTGTGNIATLASAYFFRPGLQGTSISTNVYGLLCEDHSGLGATDSINIYSKGVNSDNKYEGRVHAAECQVDLNSVVTSQFDKTTSTALADVTGLSCSVKAGATYAFEATLHVVADTVGGWKVAIGGTCTATSFVQQVTGISDSLTVVSVAARDTTKGNSQGTAADASYFVTIKGSIKVNAAGTLTTQFSQSVSNGTSSVLVGSTFLVTRIS